MTIKVDDAIILEDALRAVEENDAQVVLERDRQPVAVLVSPRFLKVFNELAEELENRMELEAYYEAKREMAERGADFVPIEEFRKELGV